MARGRDAGLGALIGGPADERQALIRTRARAQAGMVMAATAVIAVLIVIAPGFDRHLGSYWACQLLIIFGSVTQIAGLRRYGARGEHEDNPSVGDFMDERAPAPKPILPGGVATGG